MKSKFENLLCLLCVLITFLVYAHTLNYPWKHFDEQIIYKETVVPIANSFSEIIEYIKYFGLNNHFEASNPFYSSISNIRRVPLDNLITMIVFYLFKKNAFTYHAFSLLLHLINTAILFMLLNKIAAFYGPNKIKQIFIPLLTLVWALHPTNVESILFTTNWSVVLTYTFCLILVYYFINNLNNFSISYFLTIFFLSLITFSTREYPMILPLILFIYTFAYYKFYNPESSFLKLVQKSFLKVLPLIICGIIFILYTLSSPIKLVGSSDNSLSLTLERIFWFSPHIFIHFLKLIFLPVHLSIDQTAMVNFGQVLFDLYSLLCFFIMYGIILLVSFSFFKINEKSFYFIIISVVPFLISLLPFLHILSPTYCIISERYLYFPLLMLVFGISHFIFFLLNQYSKKGLLQQAPTILFIALIVFALGIRTYIRTFDWKDSVTLFSSSLKEAPNDLFRALRISMLSGIISTRSTDNGNKTITKAYLENSIGILKNTISILEDEKKNDKSPQIIKKYGLDPKTIQAKAAYLLTLNKLSLEGNFNNAYEILNPYMKDLVVIDTQILDLYLGLLFATNRLEEVEKILNFVKEKRPSPTIFIVSSEIFKRKYKDYQTSEKLLKEAFKYFPYDPQIISNLKQIYFELNKPNEYALFSYLYGLRTHSIQSLNDAYKIFTSLNNTDMANKAECAMRAIQASS